MNLREKTALMLKRMPKMTAREYLDESASLIADLLAENDMLRGLLEAEQNDCRLQRSRKDAEWERAVRAERQIKYCQSDTARHCIEIASRLAVAGECGRAGIVAEQIAADIRTVFNL